MWLAVLFKVSIGVVVIHKFTCHSSHMANNYFVFWGKASELG